MIQKYLLIYWIVRYKITVTILDSTIQKGGAMNPTEEIYDELQTAYDYFNKHLFDGALPFCLITLQREKNTYGYFSSDRFVSLDGEKTDEIAMNPRYFLGADIKEIMSTLVHEMAHAWQHHFGKAGRRGYHNKEWANKMVSIGLIPSDTGKEGGKMTGDKMADYIEIGGKFDQLCDSLLHTDFKIRWSDRFPDKKKIEEILESGNDEQIKLLENMGISINGQLVDTPEKPVKNKYTCPECFINAWGKPNLNLFCGECNIRMPLNES